MCRLALHLGDQRPLADLLYDAPHALESQAYRPRELQHGTVNVDGTGVAWWPDDDPEPLRYVTTAPPWSDPNLPALARRLRGRAILAAVRGATPGVGHGADHVAPFVHGDLAFAHNGWLGGFREEVAPTLLRQLPDDLVAGLPVVSDSRLLVLAVLARRRASVDDLPAAVAGGVEDVAAICRQAGRPATLNLVVTDGRQGVVVRRSLGLPGNSLYVLEDDPRHPTGVLVASEPLDDAPWRALEDGTLTVVADGRVRTSPLSPSEELA